MPASPRSGPVAGARRASAEGALPGEGILAVVAAAASAVGACPPGEQAEWTQRVHYLAVDLCIAAGHVAADVARIRGATPFTVFLQKVEIEESNRRGLLTLWSPERGREHIRTEPADTVGGQLMIERAEALCGRWVVVYRVNEPMHGRSDRTVRMLAHLEDAGTGGDIPVSMAKQMVLDAAGGDQCRARQAWAAMPPDGKVSAAQVAQACLEASQDR